MCSRSQRMRRAGMPSLQMPLVGVTTALYDIHMDSTTGCSWIVGAADTILHSTDGWVTWELQRACEEAVVHDVFGVVVEGAFGWLVGSSELVCYTRDAGASWHAQSADARDTSGTFRGIAALGSGACARRTPTPHLFQRWC